MELVSNPESEIFFLQHYSNNLSQKKRLPFVSRKYPIYLGLYFWGNTGAYSMIKLSRWNEEKYNKCILKKNQLVGKYRNYPW